MDKVSKLTDLISSSLVKDSVYRLHFEAPNYHAVVELIRPNVSVAIFKRDGSSADALSKPTLLVYHDSVWRGTIRDLLKDMENDNISLQEGHEVEEVTPEYYETLMELIGARLSSF